MKVSSPVITFDEATHVYFADGIRVPGVTETLSLLADYSRVPQAVLEHKRQIGRATHKAIELYEAGALDMSALDPAIVPYLDSWQAFVEQKPLRVIRLEAIVYSRKFRYAGRLDFIVEFVDGMRALLDAKCVDQMAPATALQTAAYEQAYRETDGEDIDLRAGLQLRPDGSIAKLYPYRDKKDLDIFLMALGLQNWRHNHA